MQIEAARSLVKAVAVMIHNFIKQLGDSEGPSLALDSLGDGLLEVVEPKRGR